MNRYRVRRFGLQPFETGRLELDKCVELCPVERVVESEEVRFCVFVFTEKVDKDRISIPTIVCCHKTSEITAPEMDT